MRKPSISMARRSWIVATALVAATTVVFTSTGCYELNDTLAAIPTPNQDGLALYLAPERGVVKRDQPVWLRLEIHNVGPTSRILIPEFSPALHVVVFTVDEDGGALKFVPNIRTYANLSEDSPTTIYGGQYYGQRVDLARFFTLRAGHSYRVTARYSWRHIGDSANDTVWHGELLSNPVTIKIGA